MQELLKKQMDLPRFQSNESKNSPNFPVYVATTCNLKEQLDQLIGPANFKYQLEKVNLTIGIIISSMLLFLFFI
ncbi:MAG TPA: hypothetical protein VLN45_04385 [Ignavibacteriaceae bacterium]|nr:hypothetical protein [Ignavibacteriaceae bacterium]